MAEIFAYLCNYAHAEVGNSSGSEDLLNEPLIYPFPYCVFTRNLCTNCSFEYTLRTGDHGDVGFNGCWLVVGIHLCKRLNQYPQRMSPKAPQDAGGKISRRLFPRDSCYKRYMIRQPGRQTPGDRAVLLFCFVAVAKCSDQTLLGAEPNNFQRTSSYVTSCIKRWTTFSMAVPNSMRQDGNGLLEPLVFTAILGGTAYLVLVVLYRRFFSPLSDIPGPFLASICRLWHANAIRSGKQNVKLARLHEKHGDFVRISHNEVSISHPDGVKKVLSATINKVWETSWYNNQRK